ncbi:copine-8-like isoform X2 [Liolophura sinensis]|uniref:copine-8-like isoform X2 n=1 Tax=Liolophura sinensis TaxID=3198878 RepID=UPI003158B4F0
MADFNQPFRPGEAVIPATQVEISVSCRNLQDKDILSKSDPVCVLFTKETGNNQYFEYGRTEMIKDTLNPDFVKKFNINYFFEECQKLKFEIYDVDTPGTRLDQQDFLGRFECTLAEIISSPSGKLERPLGGPGNAKRGSITVRAEELSNSKEVIHFQFKATNLDKMDFFGKSDPFLVFKRANEDSSYTVVHKTEVIKNTLNPTWRPFSISGRALCNGDYDRTIKVECYDWNSNGTSDFIGEFVTNLRELTRGAGTSNNYEVINPQKKKKKKSYKNSGQVHLLSCKIETPHTFIDFIKGGMQMNFTVAIDFTASNGNPSQPNSLHYLSPYQPNAYAMAIQSVGEIIQDYDSDKLFPALGFGARIPPNGVVSHEFPLNFNPQNPYCQGITGVLQAYYQSLQSVQLYGPTNFAPVINHVARFAQSIRDGSHYFVLLIITDGVISDMPQTISAIVAASSLPMSIIIVGVGDADFTAMDILDADDDPLVSNGRRAERDIVQFVPLKNFVNRQGMNVQLTQARLAKEVLAEVPTQVISYMKKNNIVPKPTTRASAPSLPQGSAMPPSGSVPSWHK